MKKLFLLFGLGALLTSANQVYAISKAVSMSNNIGVVIGKGMYCGFDTEELTKRLQNVIQHYAVNQQDDAAATKQFIQAAGMAAQVGPGAAGESCSQFRSSFNETNRMLR